MFGDAAVAEIDPNGGGAGAQIATASIAAGASSTPNSGGGLEFDPLAAGTTTVTASIPGFIATTAASQSVVVTGSAITLPPLGTLGGGLQNGAFGGQLGTASHGGVTVHVESADPSRVLVAANGTALGAASIDIAVVDGSGAFTFFLQGTDWLGGTSSTASVTVTASSPGFASGSNTVDYVQPAVRLAGLPTSTTALSASDDFTAQVGIPNAAASNLTVVQERRAGASALTATVTNSAAAVAEIDPNGGGAGAQVATTSISAGAFSTPNNAAGGLEFDPLAVGTTTVAVSIPDFITTAAGSQAVVVAGSGITVPALGDLGGGLQRGAINGVLGASNHGGVTVHVESADPSRVLLAPNATTPGGTSVDVFVANGATLFGFYMQGTDWVSGTSSAATVTVTASASGFASGSNTVDYVQPALRLAGLPTSMTTLSANNDFLVQIGTPTAGNLNISTLEDRRAGAPALVVTVTNGDAAVAEIDPNGGGAGAQIATASIVAGANGTPNNAAGGLEIDPVGVGTTTVAASIPGFIVTTAGSATVTVGTPSITVPVQAAVGSGLQSALRTGQLGASAHGGVTVHLASSDPTRLLIAPNTSTAGAATLDVAVANGQVNFSYVLQGTDWVDGTSSAATVVVTASAPGFLDGTSTTDYQQAALRLSGLVTSTTASAANDDFIVQVGLPNAGATTVTTVQNRRAGAPALVVTVTNCDAAVAELDPNGGGAGAQSQTANIAAGQSSTPNNAAGGLEFDPLGAGSTTVSASLPGFIVTTAGSQVVSVSP
jgi:hypothetical protein